MRHSYVSTAGQALAVSVGMAIVLLSSGPASVFGATEGRDAQLTDEALKVQVEEALRLDSRLDWRFLKVTVTDRTAFLRGQVRTPEERGLATGVVSSISGIHAVENQILVDSTVPSHKETGQAHIEDKTRDRVLESPGPLKDKQIMP